MSVGRTACDQVPDLTVTRIRSAQAPQRRIGLAHDEASCRESSLLFWKAVNARHAASICEEGAKRQLDLEVLDTEINALNDLIAVQCGS